jgi:protein tyrosine/serine phosphatase
MTSEMKMLGLRRGAMLGVGLVSVVLVAWLGVVVYHEVVWKKFAVVVPGKVYRSGLLKEHQLRSAINDLGLKTVICLVPERAEREKRICDEEGISFRSFTMHSSGDGRPEDYAEVVRILADDNAQPVLVHCHAGVARTGAAIALFRMSEQGWSLEQAIEELRSFERRGHIEPALRAHIENIFATRLADGRKSIDVESSRH